MQCLPHTHRYSVTTQNSRDLPKNTLSDVGIQNVGVNYARLSQTSSLALTSLSAGLAQKQNSCKTGKSLQMGIILMILTFLIPQLLFYGCKSVCLPCRFCSFVREDHFFENRDPHSSLWCRTLWDLQQVLNLSLKMRSPQRGKTA